MSFVETIKSIDMKFANSSGLFKIIIVLYFVILSAVLQNYFPEKTYSIISVIILYFFGVFIVISKMDTIRKRNDDLDEEYPLSNCCEECEADITRTEALMDYADIIRKEE